MSARIGPRLLLAETAIDEATDALDGHSCDNRATDCDHILDLRRLLAGAQTHRFDPDADPLPCPGPSDAPRHSVQPTSQGWDPLSRPQATGMLVAASADERTGHPLLVVGDSPEELHARMAAYHVGRDWEILATEAHTCPALTTATCHGCEAPRPHPHRDVHDAPCPSCRANEQLLHSLARPEAAQRRL